MQEDQLSRLDFVAETRTPDFPSARYVGDGAPVGFFTAVGRQLRGSVYGRASRSEFWYFWLFSVFLNIASFVVLDGMLDLANIDRGVSSLISIFVTIAFIRRLHDVGKSGWWVLISLTIVGLIPLFVWSVRKGDTHPNRYDLRGKESDLEYRSVVAPAAGIDELERLHRLRLSGAITDEEYRVLKQRAL